MCVARAGASSARQCSARVCASVAGVARLLPLAHGVRCRSLHRSGLAMGSYRLPWRLAAREVPGGYRVVCQAASSSLGSLTASSFLRRFFGVVSLFQPGGASSVPV
jgi:hypothetical protein